jgi:Cu-Zn family superoxide dismutase
MGGKSAVFLRRGVLQLPLYTKIKGENMYCAKKLLVIAIMGITGCSQSDGENGSSAKATLSPIEGSGVYGEVTFTTVKNGTKVIADVDGLTPGQHGFHIHEHGDCSASDGSSAGGHYNPTQQKHGCPNSRERHVGDLGNISADKTGHAHYERVDKVIRLTGPYSIVGKSVIVHEKADDCKSQPAGDSGKRVACGAIVGPPQ